MLQLVPMRPYFNGEVVAVDAANLSVAVAAAGGEDAGLVYAEIDVPPPTTGRRDRIALRVGSSRTVVHCLPLHVHSFRSQRRTAGGGGGGVEADVTNGGRTGERPEAGTEAESGSAAAASGSATHAGTTSGGPSSTELVDAVSSVLKKAGVPISLETQKLLDANLTLQAELSQYKHDLEERSLEASKAKRELEASSRSTTCQVCMERRKDIVINVCGHMLCGTCMSTGQIDRCPFCRREITTGTTRLRW